MQIKLWLVLLLSFAVASCGGGAESAGGGGDSGGSGGSSAGSNEPRVPTVQPETEGNDPLAALQWHLNNTGQYNHATNAATSGQDINAFGGSELSLVNYADGLTGEGVEIAILDSGLEIYHEDLVNNVVTGGSYNFSTSNGRTKYDPTSDNSNGDHGTSVAGIAAARGGNSLGGMGVAPKAALRGFNILEYGGVEEELASLGRANSYGIDLTSTAIFNRSYGTNPLSVSDGTDAQGIADAQTLAALKQGAETLRDQKGAIYVKAGGNEYYSAGLASSYWASYCGDADNRNLTCYNVNQEPENTSPYQIVVAGYNSSGTRASYSNTGAAIWISAPAGEFGSDSPAIVTTDQSSCFKGYSQVSPSVANSFNNGIDASNRDCDYFNAFNGTSAATPIVSGLAALMLEANPDLRWYEVKHILAMTARQLEPALAYSQTTINGQLFDLDRGWITNNAGVKFSNAYGFGSVDVLAAVAMAKQWKSNQTSLGAFVEIAKDSGLSEATAKDIPDFDVAGQEVKFSITESHTVQSVQVTLTIKAQTGSAVRSSNKIDASDFWIEVTSPQGSKSILLTPFNAFNSGYDMPNFTLISHGFYGETMAGEWTLKVVDVDNQTNNHIVHVGEGKITAAAIKLFGYQ